MDEDVAFSKATTRITPEDLNFPAKQFIYTILNVGTEFCDIFKVRNILYHLYLSNRAISQDKIYLRYLSIRIFF